MRTLKPSQTLILHPGNLGDVNNEQARGIGCSVLGRGAEPLVRTQFLEHPPTLSYGANHLKNGFSTLKKPPSPFFPHITRIIGVVFLGGVKELEHS